jgi:hypothetical protein
MESLQSFATAFTQGCQHQARTLGEETFWARDTQVMPNFNRFFTHDFEFGVET